MTQIDEWRASLGPDGPDVGSDVVGEVHEQRYRVAWKGFMGGDGHLEWDYDLEKVKAKAREHSHVIGECCYVEREGFGGGAYWDIYR